MKHVCAVNPLCSTSDPVGIDYYYCETEVRQPAQRGLEFLEILQKWRIRKQLNERRYITLPS
jgi:hypothetical protein